MNPDKIIHMTIDQISALKKSVGVDKKWLNKTIARLEEAEVFAEKIIVKGSLATTPEALQTATKPLRAECVCLAGVRDKNCVIHGW